MATSGKKKPKQPIPETPEIIELSPLEDAMENPIQQPPRMIVTEKGDAKLEEIREEPIQTELTVRQKRFCQLYATDIDFMGNGVQAYLEVYDVDTSKPGWYKTACAAASRLLSNVKIYTYINDLLETNGLNDQFVDKQLLYLIQQHDDKGNKLGAIKEYNKLKQRITDKIQGEVTLITPTAINIIKPE